MVVKLLLEFDVPAEKMTTFVKLAAETWVPAFKKFPEIKDIHYNQTVAGKPMVVKELTFADLNAWTSFMQKYLSDPKMQKIVGEFYSFTVNLETKLVMQII
jgi:hypothetical protein